MDAAGRPNAARNADFFEVRVGKRSNMYIGGGVLVLILIILLLVLLF